MARGGRKRKHQGRFSGGKLDKKQKHHLREYGELHPADVKDGDTERYRKVQDQSAFEVQAQISSSEDSGDEGTSAYKQLVSTLGAASKHHFQDDVETSEEEAEESEEESTSNENTVKAGTSKGAEHVTETVSEPDRNSEGDGGEEGDDEGQEEEEEGEEGGGDEEDKTGDYRADVGESDEDEGNEKEAEEGKEEVFAITDPFSQHFEHDLKDVQSESMAEKPWKQKEVKVKQSLCGQIAATNVKLCQADLTGSDCLTPFQQSLFSVINDYQDVYYADRTHVNGEEIRLAYCLHALNHILKTRSRVIAHNSKIKSKKDEVPDDYRDQGLTRPKVLIVLPFRESALRTVRVLSNLLMSQEQSYVNNKKRFEKEFGLEEDVTRGFKPEDFEHMFTGNIDDHFRIGIGIAKKSLKLYTEFYSSDIILASPLGLRTMIGAEGEEERDFDFLSSIELLIFDQTDVFLMQNWDHILHLMQHLHIQPKDSHGVDFSRVRMWSLDGWSKYYRQNLVFSSVLSPQVNALFNKHCHTHYNGKVTVPKPLTSGAICQIVTQLPQVFHRVEADSYSQLAEARFQFFKSKILPQHKDSVMKHTLIFIPSYFDFVRVRNYLKKEEKDFVQVCEYSKDSSVSRARYFFYHGKTHYMLYTERFHFYRRFRIRGIRHIIFYELPLYPHFYSEMCNSMKDPKKLREVADFTCSVLYSRYDAQRLVAVVGADRAAHMMNSEKGVHMFVTGDS